MLGDEISIALCGNKADMEKSRAVSAKEVVDYAAAIGGTHHLTSAKTGAGVAEAFSELLKRACIEKLMGGEREREEERERERKREAPAARLRHCVRTCHQPRVSPPPLPPQAPSPRSARQPLRGRRRRFRGQSSPS